MFRKSEARHPLIYADITANYKFVEGKTFGEMQAEIDEIYRSKVNAYGLADEGYFNDDPESKADAEKSLDEFFEKKKLTGKI